MRGSLAHRDRFGGKPAPVFVTIPDTWNSLPGPTALGGAPEAAAARIDLGFLPTDGTYPNYAVVAVADVSWSVVNFGVLETIPHTFSVNTANFALTGSYTSAGVVGYNNDIGVIGPCPGSGCFPAVATISLGTFLGGLGSGVSGILGPTDLAAGGREAS